MHFSHTNGKREGQRLQAKGTIGSSSGPSRTSPSRWWDKNGCFRSLCSSSACLRARPLFSSFPPPPRAFALPTPIKRPYASYVLYFVAWCEITVSDSLVQIRQQ
uniref:Uncharacterized protein n=1 Tax=Mesocestoides corti TaxID=53468 RepID=A0A5K3EQQ6_MESCO